MENDQAQDEVSSSDSGGQPTLGRRRLLEAGFWTSAGVVGLTLAGAGTRFLAGNSFDQVEAQWVAIGEIASFAAGQVQKTVYQARQKDAWRSSERTGVIYVVADGNGEYRALDATCTHLGCNVHWKAECGCFRCPCHDAEFAADGSVVSGPPPGPLLQRATKVENATLYVLL